MPVLNPSPTRIPVPGGKLIEEHLGLASTGDRAASVAYMTAPPNWTEPYQRPEFHELTLVLSGTVLVDSDDGQIVVGAGQSVLTRAGERIRYSTAADGAQYVAVCVPAFSPDSVNREDEPS